MAVCLSGSLGVWKFSHRPLASRQDHCFPALLPFSLCLIDCATVNATPNSFKLPPPCLSRGRPPVKCGGDSLLTHPKLGLLQPAASPPHTSRLCQWCRAELTVALPICAVTVLGSLQPCFFPSTSPQLPWKQGTAVRQTGAVCSAAVLSEGLDLGFS